MSKEFQSRIVLGKKRNTCIHQYEQSEQQRRDQDQNDKSGKWENGRLIVRSGR